ncbi:hypothetical protein KV097_05440 [Mumia sp. zg.B17]|uniref:DUF6343 family protein n=1 Tax=unclassified Mumia TaxID=2621872 RepID=UPI001C6EAFD5|nr:MULTISPECIES: DUF6343 family protein [unclassified Mumia]MBW9205382.1 hypothetical protein [Mumia sp. zg.B17]MDD9350470.1 DUF6343 family protein [Mumia sp.]
MHTGSEPKKALSAYGMRLALSLGGFVVFAALALWGLLLPDATDVMVVLGLASAVIAVVALVDTAVIVRKMRSRRSRRPV